VRPFRKGLIGNAGTLNSTWLPPPSRPHISPGTGTTRRRRAVGLHSDQRSEFPDPLAGPTSVPGMNVPFCDYAIKRRPICRYPSISVTDFSADFRPPAFPRAPRRRARRHQKPPSGPISRSLPATTPGVEEALLSLDRFFVRRQLGFCSVRWASASLEFGLRFRRCAAILERSIESCFVGLYNGPTIHLDRLQNPVTFGNRTASKGCNSPGNAR